MLSPKEFFKLLIKCKNQFFVTFCVNLSTLSCGTLVGWCSPALVTLTTHKSMLYSGPVNVSQASWIASCHYIGEASGVLIFLVISRYVGQKFVIIVTGVMYTLSWLIILYGNHIIAILVGKCLAGLSSGGSVLCIPLLVANIADNEIRGVLGSFLAVSFQMGITISYITGSFLSYNNMIYVSMIFPIVFFLTMLTIPESPQFLLSKNQLNNAIKSLQFYKNYAKLESEEFKKELISLEKFTIQKKQPTEKIQWKDFCERETLHGLIVSNMLMVFLVCSGLIISMSYGASILQASSTNWDPNKSTIVMGFVLVIGTAFSSIIVDIVGRKWLLTASLTGCTIGLSILGSYMYYSHFGHETIKSMHWIPVTSLSIVMLASTLGIAPIPFVMMTEVVPAKLRAVCSVMCLFVRSVLLFFVLKMHPVLSVQYGPHSVIWFYAIICFIGIFFCIFFVPETKGKSINVV